MLASFEVRGLDIPIAGAPRQRIHPGPALDTVGLIGADYPGVRPALRVREGDRVEVGQAIFVDRRRPDIVFAAPVAGRVRAIRHGPKRRLESVAIAVEKRHSAARVATPGAHSRAGLRALLCASGLWPALRARPFGYIPDPDAKPEAIFIAAIDTLPLAADPAVVIAEHGEAFLAGQRVLQRLTDGPVYVCQAPGPALGDNAVVFAGPHPAGLPGTHIHHLHPIGGGAVVWHLGYQDVVAIGHLVSTGAPWTERVVSLGGPSVREPRLLRTTLGASIDTLVAGELAEGPTRVLSGSVLDGRAQAYLGRYHNQLTALPERVRPTGLSFHRRARSTALEGRPGPIVPLRAHERGRSLDAPPIPLLRALSVGDTESAERLGALEMVEEDVALLSYLCPSKADYGQLLRGVLEQGRDGGQGPAPIPETPAVTTTAPHVRAAHSGARVTALLLVALLAPLGWASTQAGAGLAWALGVAVPVSIGWQLVFAWLRHRSLLVETVAAQLVTALAIVLMLPPEAPLWQLGLGTSVGVVLGEQIFGGRGYNFLSPTVVALAFLAFSFPDVAYGAGGNVPWSATLPGAVLLVAAGIVSWHVLGAMAVATVAVPYGTIELLPDVLDVNTLVFAAVFLGGDPVAAPVTRTARVLYGLLVGALWGLGVTQGAIAVVSALLLGGIFAPLLDHSAVLGHGAWRRRRHG